MTLVLNEDLFKSNFKGVFGLNLINSKESIIKIESFVNNIIKIEYKKDEELNIIEENEKFLGYLGENFVFNFTEENKLNILTLKESFLEKYRVDILGLFKEEDFKEVKYGYKHFYFLNLKKISDALYLIGKNPQDCLISGNKFVIENIIKEFNISEKEKILNYIENNETSITTCSYFLRKAFNEIKHISNLATFGYYGYMIRGTKELREFNLEKENIKEYFENNNRFNFEELISLVENENVFFKNEEQKREAIELLRICLA